jgi:hypothetical protein
MVKLSKFWWPQVKILNAVCVNSSIGSVMFLFLFLFGEPFLVRFVF